jgi:hypothetical protein
MLTEIYYEVDEFNRIGGPKTTFGKNTSLCLQHKLVFQTPIGLYEYERNHDHPYLLPQRRTVTILITKISRITMSNMLVKSLKGIFQI